MGTLFDQPTRDPQDIDTDDVRGIYSWLVKGAPVWKGGDPHEDMLEHGPDFMSGATLMLEVMKYLQLKRIGDLMARDGDVRDEQLAGIGSILQDIVASLEESVDDERN